MSHKMETYYAGTLYKGSKIYEKIEDLEWKIPLKNNNEAGNLFFSLPILVKDKALTLGKSISIIHLKNKLLNITKTRYLL